MRGRISSVPRCKPREKSRTLLSQRENLGALPAGFSELGLMVFAVMGCLVFPHGAPWGAWDPLPVASPQISGHFWGLLAVPWSSLCEGVVGLRAEPSAAPGGTSPKLTPILSHFHALTRVPTTTAGGTGREPGTPRAPRSFCQPKDLSLQPLSAGWVLQEDGICAPPDALLAVLW